MTELGLDRVVPELLALASIPYPDRSESMRMQSIGRDLSRTCEQASR
jgi:hypothetical protein